ncbi:MAG: hypothetical protein Nkreftii_000065 [Candidatus Nitrospira kreftii]|uniref:Uncharacterized protein n=1 Tax=Candidatus Nitrospira kreftii TaxID=2652173 RepID=A0A7S8FAL4_9BACT|nr:MAG: hypothetical protein Nkreftii_000065 [Candidatus Nitrospira kreftii]
MTTNISSKRPANTLRSGNINATIWQNVSEKGPFFATTFLGHLRINLVPGARHLIWSHLEALLNVAFEAKEWMTAHTLKR